MKTQLPTAEQLQLDWNNHPRWQAVTRDYSADDVVRLRGTVPVEHSLARHGAERLWRDLHHEPFVNALGALTGNQAVQQVKAGLKAIYLSGWQVAADANLAGVQPIEVDEPFQGLLQWRGIVEAGRGIARERRPER